MLLTQSHCWEDSLSPGVSSEERRLSRYNWFRRLPLFRRNQFGDQVAFFRLHTLARVFLNSLSRDSSAAFDGRRIIKKTLECFAKTAFGPFHNDCTYPGDLRLLFPARSIDDDGKAKCHCFHNSHAYARLNDVHGEHVMVQKYLYQAVIRNRIDELNTFSNPTPLSRSSQTISERAGANQG